MIFSCCVDVVAAEHYSADSLIHYGHSCLSEVVKLPVYYVFEKANVEVSEVKREIQNLKSTLCEKIVVIYDVCFFYLLSKYLFLELIGLTKLYDSYHNQR
jgi:diphthamide biosynthesis protein 2